MLFKAAVNEWGKVGLDKESVKEGRWCDHGRQQSVDCDRRCEGFPVAIN